MFIISKQLALKANLVVFQAAYCVAYAYQWNVWWPTELQHTPCSFSSSFHCCWNRSYGMWSPGKKWEDLFVRFDSLFSQSSPFKARKRCSTQLMTRCCLSAIQTKGFLKGMYKHLLLTLISNEVLLTTLNHAAEMGKRYRCQAEPCAEGFLERSTALCDRWTCPGSPPEPSAYVQLSQLNLIGAIKQSSCINMYERAWDLEWGAHGHWGHGCLLTPMNHFTLRRGDLRAAKSVCSSPAPCWDNVSLSYASIMLNTLPKWLPERAGGAHLEYFREKGGGGGMIL